MRTLGRGGIGLFICATAFSTMLIEARAQPPGSQPTLTLHARVRDVAQPSETPRAYDSLPREKLLRWNPSQTAIIICDMWNQHWCKGATRRVGELAPAMNRTVAGGTRQGAS